MCNRAIKIAGRIKKVPRGRENKAHARARKLHCPRIGRREEKSIHRELTGENGLIAARPFPPKLRIVFRGRATLMLGPARVQRQVRVQARTPLHIPASQPRWFTRLRKLSFAHEGASDFCVSLSPSLERNYRHLLTRAPGRFPCARSRRTSKCPEGDVSVSQYRE